MNEINWQYIGYLLIIVLMLVITMGVILSAGCVTAAKTIYKDATATPIPTPTPKPTPIPTTPTPIPTPAGIPTLAAHFVDPYFPGQRWEGQWYKWHRVNVQGINGEGLKDLEVGIVVYRHEFVDKLTYYNNLWGQYYDIKPSNPDSRFFIVWIHEEMLGNTTEYDPSMWIFDADSFRLQIDDRMLSNIMPVIPEYVIKEFENKYDYYNTIRAPPFGYIRVYTGQNPETGGWTVQEPGFLRMGKGNSIDGYLIYEVPRGTLEKQLIETGRFSTFGDAYWRFSIN